jgi:hypothetical protein
MFSGRKLLIATKHQKEKVIAPLMERELGVRCFVAEHFDTDLLGTFTGEVERKDEPITTARTKCLMAMQQYDCDLAVASEGSFGAHPSIFFIPADDEILFFIDKKNQLEITGRELSTETNFGGEEIKTEKQLLDFARQVKFPSHGLILRKAKDDLTELKKGITDWNELKTNFHFLMSKYGTAYVETDMRAMYNPSRMKVIEKATEKLVAKINSHCPQCSTPGFGVVDARKGLPCKQCNFPTRSVLSYIYTCQKCSYTKEDWYPNQLTAEDPRYCDICNP